MPPRPDVSAERRAQIIEAALACFVRKGYTNTTMDDIAAECGLSKGTLYWYFKSKDDLFTAAMGSVFEEFGEDVLLEVAQHETVTEQLRAGARLMVDLCRTGEGLFGLFVEFWSQSDRREEAGQYWADMLMQYARMIATIAEEGIHSGEFKPVDVEALAWAIMAAYDGLAAYMTLKPDLDPDRVSDAFIETLLNGLLADTEHVMR
jgi:AcrR family transcriptional regulator